MAAEGLLGCFATVAAGEGCRSAETNHGSIPQATQRGLAAQKEAQRSSQRRPAEARRYHGTMM
jgi:hypothetical protein